MPTQINGIGTTYLGRANLEQHPGVCEHCHLETMLQNYETRTYFTFIYIPLIPLGRLQIFESCPSCSWHKSMPLAEWERVKTEAIQNSGSDWAAAKDDPDKAVEYHATLAAFRKSGEADKLAEAMGLSFANNADVQFYLGTYHEQSGRGVEADACFRRALDLEPDNLNAVRAVGIGLIEQGKLDEGRQMLRALEPPSEHYDPVVFVMLGKAYQLEDNHAAALEQFYLVLKHTPDAKRDKDFRRMVRESETVTGVSESAVPADRIYHSKKFWWSTAAAIVVGLILYWNHYVANHRTLHVVNGLPIPITVRVDEDHTVTIPARQRRPVQLAEGQHRAVVTQPDGVVEPFDFEMTTSYVARFFRDPVFVLDPSQSSMVIWYQAVYSANPNNNDDDYKIHLGQPYTYFDDIDYPFKRFPSEIETESSRVVKTRVEHYTNDPFEVLSGNPDILSPDETLALYERRLLFVCPADMDVLETYTQKCNMNDQLDRAVDFLRNGLDARPVDVDWHRHYQNIARISDDVDLITMYDEFLAQDANNSHLIYLRGRLAPRIDESMEYFERAIAADAKNSYPWAAKSYAHQLVGEFGPALETLAKASELAPERSELQESLQDLLVATKQWSRIDLELDEQLQQSPNDLSLMIQGMSNGAAAQSLNLVNQWLKKIRTFLKTNDADASVIAQIEALGAYYKGQFAKANEAAAQIADPETQAHFQFQAQVELGNLSSAEELHESLKDSAQKGLYELSLLLAWQGQDNEERVNHWREQSIASLRERGAEGAFAASLLDRAQSESVTFEEARSVSLITHLKRLWLVVLADSMESDDRQQTLDLAAALNFDPNFPHLLIRRRIQQRQE